MGALMSSFIVGFIFALGLGLSGMTDPVIVKGFLTPFHQWDPSLLFVMAGAVGVHMLTYRLITRRPSPLLAEKFQIPTRQDLNWKLIIGAVIFGLGWGWAGYCPGPAVTSLGSAEQGVFVFVGSMVLGMILFRLLSKIFPRLGQ